MGGNKKGRTRLLQSVGRDFFQQFPLLRGSQQKKVDIDWKRKRLGDGRYEKEGTKKRGSYGKEGVKEVERKRCADAGKK